MKNNNMMTVIIALLVGIGAFYGGVQYQKNQVPANSFQMGGRQFGAGTGNGVGAGAGTGRIRNGGGQVIGEVIALDDKSMTVKLADGSSKIVLISSKTSFNKAEAATAGDIKVGDRVASFGTANSDGSETATMIQLNPVMRGPTSMPTGGAPKQ